MCGILAVLGLEGASVQEIRDRLSALSRRIRHRGPDWSGNLVFQMQNGKYAALYHERLAIVDPASGE